MRGHGLIQRGQALVFFLFSAVNGGEGSGGRKTDARRVGVRHDLVSSSWTSGKKGDERWRGGLMAPWEKPLVQPAARWLLRWRPLEPELIDSLCHDTDLLIRSESGVA